jgi:hypothetical protein
MPSIVVPLLVDKAHWNMFHETMKTANEIMIYSNFGKQRHLSQFIRYSSACDVMIFVAANKKATEPRVPIGYVEVITFVTNENGCVRLS